MFDFMVMSNSTIIGGLIILLVLLFLRFGDTVVDHLLAYQSSPVQAVENSMTETSEPDVPSDR